jgi:hypothetical protein
VSLSFPFSLLSLSLSLSLSLLLACVLQISTTDFNEPNKQVTVISLSARLARVVHGYVDVLANNVRVFKSPILNVDTENNRPEMELLISWCIGQATGPTKWAHLE